MCKPVLVLAKSYMDWGSVEGFETHGLVALIATFVLKRLLICLHEVAVLCEKKTVTMYIHSPIHMDGNKVIEASLRC
jgi:hypothetical protein